MADGTRKAIEKIKASDKAVATDPATGKTEPRMAMTPLNSKGLKPSSALQLTLTAEW
ncbi:hypothetical protein [Streptosporangium vulgare]|uniref:Uncharacterized protein n=1 Tax=Streptosporangium vulgare TaxID=46190 RepID=A0ABV5TQ00_9ACTN